MNRFLEKTKVKLPIIQAGMAGGITTPELVATVANEGGLGTIGAGYMTPVALQRAIQQVKQLTKQPFAVNLFATNLQATSNDLEPMQSALDVFRKRLGIESGSSQVQVDDYLEEHMEVLLEEKIPMISTAFGMLSDEQVMKLKTNRVTLLGMATNVKEAKQLEEAGYDIIVAQGSEAGGHRGTFQITDYPEGCNIGLVALLSSIKQHVKLPVVATGGIVSKEQVEGLFKMGAEAVQIGTRFLLAKEAGTAPSYKAALLAASGEDTVITTFFSGRPARGVANTFTRELKKKQMKALPFPIQNACTKDIRKAAKEQNNAAYQSLWAGQGVGQLNQEETVKDILVSLL
ncbi:NAD(P)H-dependent flavin oxidoreductase [Virgibacillus chiguensis]|uniref:Probable nitronate monooxygenase n=1 Tax=Virgibacillus chiguensis TaxID=411959 RepID=A0A1M5R9V3_9BACI|nr:nitronate monooxygenase [Virgibacillus chiguensis]SHH22880.1 nitronate monooxygenase [Virgibacillus chiguensis]